MNKQDQLNVIKEDFNVIVKKYWLAIGDETTSSRSCLVLMGRTDCQTGLRVGEIH